MLQLNPVSKPDLGSFVWDDPFLLENQLTEDERMLRDAARAYAEEKLAPRIIAAFREERVEPEIFPEIGEMGLLGVTTPEEMPVTETIELLARLRSETGAHASAVIANRVLPVMFNRREQTIVDRLDEARGNLQRIANVAAALGGELPGYDELARRALDGELDFGPFGDAWESMLDDLNTAAALGDQICPFT